jgi:hypothetical protein
MKDKLVYLALVLTSALSALGLAMTPGILAACAMMFDAPGSERNSALHVVFWSAITFPPVCLVTIIASWLVYRRNHSAVAVCAALLPLVNVAVAFFAFESMPNSGYELENGEWAYVLYTFGGRFPTKLDGADAASFSIVPEGRGYFAKDNTHVWMQQHIIPGADPRTFTPIRWFYTKDRVNVYSGTVTIPGADPATFEVLSGGSALETSYDKEGFADWYGKGFESVEISRERPAVVAIGWARDKNTYFYGPTRVEGADYETFKVIDAFTAADKNRRYHGAKPE